MDEAKRVRAKLTGEFTVTERPEPIPGDLRLGWGVSLLLLVLASSRGQRCSLQKVHFLVHLSRTEQSRRQMREVLERRRGPVDLSVRIEPWVNRAAAFAAANGLVHVRDGKALGLADGGKVAVATIRKEGLLQQETAFLDDVGKLATEQVVERIMKMEAF
jgi:hypothetical protein